MSARGKCKQLLGNAARVASWCSRGEGLSLTPSTLHPVQELLAAWGPAATLDP